MFFNIFLKLRFALLMFFIFFTAFYASLSAAATQEDISPKDTAFIDIDKQDTETGNTLLHKKVLAKDLAGVKELLAQGANRNIKNKVQQTPLSLAIANKQDAIIDILSVLTPKDKAFIKDDINNKLPNTGNTLLHTKAAKGELEAVKELLDRGANADLKNKKGYTPLPWAIVYDSVSGPLLDVLFEATKDKQNLITVMNYLLTKGQGNTKIAYQIVNKLYKIDPATIDTPFWDNNTMLTILCSIKNITKSKSLGTEPTELLEQIITDAKKTKNSADFSKFINAKTTGSGTALHCAVLSNNVKLATVLIENGADASITNQSQESGKEAFTPLSMAISDNPVLSQNTKLIDKFFEATNNVDALILALNTLINKGINTITKGQTELNYRNKLAYQIVKKLYELDSTTINTTFLSNNTILTILCSTQEMPLSVSPVNYKTNQKQVQKALELLEKIIQNYQSKESYNTDVVEFLNVIKSRISELPQAPKTLPSSKFDKIFGNRISIFKYEDILEVVENAMQKKDPQKSHADLDAYKNTLQETLELLQKNIYEETIDSLNNISLEQQDKTYKLVKKIITETKDKMPIDYDETLDLLTKIIETAKKLKADDFLNFINQQNASKYTALHFAIKKQNITMAKILVDNRADVTLKDNENKSVLDILSEMPHVVSNVKVTDWHPEITKSNEVVLKMNFFIKSYTTDAIASSIVTNATTQLTTPDALANFINSKDKIGNTPLHNAVLNHNNLLIEVLIKNKADVNIQNNEGNTPLHIAAINHNFVIVKILLSSEQLKTSFDDFNKFINAQDGNGNTALHNATFSQSDALVEILIKNKADVNIQNKEGNTPLHIAAINNNLAIVKILLSSVTDININIKNNDGKTASEIAQAQEPRSVIAQIIGLKSHIEELIEEKALKQGSQEQQVKASQRQWQKAQKPGTPQQAPIISVHRWRAAFYNALSKSRESAINAIKWLRRLRN